MIKERYTIWIVSPDDYPTPRSFDEVALSLQSAFAALGYDVPIVRDRDRIEGTAIVLGAILLLRQANVSLPRNCVIYNLEQVFPGSPWFTSTYLEMLKTVPVWDYSPRNIALLQRLGVKRVSLCPIGFAPTLERIPVAEKGEDIDVLHYGALNERRKAVLEELAARGLKVKHLYGCYGERRDAWIARAKIALNIHFYEAKVFEIVRVSYLLANRRFVISEPGSDSEMEQSFRGGVVFAPYEKLVDTCCNYIQRQAVREGVSRKGYAIFREMDQAKFLQEIISP